jgi:hypothetical protein
MAAPEGEASHAPDGAVVWLEVVEGPGQGSVFPLSPGRPAVVGRGPLRGGPGPPGVDIPLPCLSLSRRHCEVRWDGCRVWVHDLNSNCGTKINGKHFRDGGQVREPEGRLLRLGDVLRPGRPGLRLGTPLRAEAAWLAWGGGVAGKMVQTIDAEGRFADLPVLADALEEAGCTNVAILGHCRGPGEHVRGCWVVDLLLGKE